ncbi:hypothetical protein DM02DRAFT_272108 [Periconia macrospinosa]|uniref:Uncharacterized protein n=1 Tax=Periconia macrospinosa TaxID=97972 RepID=A0A2V1D4Y1_9PLEO|nr:hypothetical protein DM02DRAFT_272108 [Periconia macrospinosa]
MNGKGSGSGNAPRRGDEGKANETGRGKRVVGKQGRFEAAQEESDLRRQFNRPSRVQSGVGCAARGMLRGARASMARYRQESRPHPISGAGRGGAGPAGERRLASNLQCDRRTHTHIYVSWQMQTPTYSTYGRILYNLHPMHCGMHYLFAPSPLATKNSVCRRIESPLFIPSLRAAEGGSGTCPDRMSVRHRLAFPPWPQTRNLGREYRAPRDLSLNLIHVRGENVKQGQ